jgi:hypothetical protein
MPCSPAGAWATRRCLRLRVSVQVISVGATQHPNNTRADFSTWNLDLELMAPGQAILSTLSKSSKFYYDNLMDTGVQVTTKPAAAANLNFPAPQAADGSGYGTVTATLVDCGLGTAACTGAKGKVCLIQRGQIYYCEKVMNCQRAGGLAAIMYNGDTAGPCDAFNATLLSSGAETCNNRTKYIPTVTLALQQGRAIKALIVASKGAATATVTVPDPVEYTKRVGGLPGPELAIACSWPLHNPPAAAFPAVWVDFTSCPPPAGCALRGFIRHQHGHTRRGWRGGRRLVRAPAVHQPADQGHAGQDGA